MSLDEIADEESLDAAAEDCLGKEDSVEDDSLDLFVLCTELTSAVESLQLIRRHNTDIVSKAVNFLNIFINASYY